MSKDQRGAHLRPPSPERAPSDANSSTQVNHDAGSPRERSEISVSRSSTPEPRRSFHIRRSSLEDDLLGLTEQPDLSGDAEVPSQALKRHMDEETGDEPAAKKDKIIEELDEMMASSHSSTDYSDEDLEGSTTPTPEDQKSTIANRQLAIRGGRQGRRGQVHENTQRQPDKNATVGSLGTIVSPGEPQSDPPSKRESNAPQT